MTRAVALCLFFAIALVACGGGGSEPTVGDQNDPGVDNPPNSGGSQPPADGLANFAVEDRVFTLEEDSTFTLRLSTVPAAQPATSSRFALIDESESHLLQLSENGELHFEPADDFFGEVSFRYYAWGEYGGTLPGMLEFVVTPVEDAPSVVFSPALFVDQGRRYLARIYATDADNDELTFEASNVPAWLEFDTTTGLLRGYPGQGDVGVHGNIMLSVIDETGIRTSVPPFSIEVLDINESPDLNPVGVPESMLARQRVTFGLNPFDPDGDRVVFDAEPNAHLDIDIEGNEIALEAKDVSRVIETELILIARDSAGSLIRESYPIVLYPVTSSGRGQTLVGRKFGNGVHMVILGDGYVDRELLSFQDHAFDLVGLMKSDPAINTHFGAWNIHTVSTPSVDSGIDSSSTMNDKDTVYDTTYGCLDIDRLICGNQTRMFEEALQEYPYLDQIVLLVNDRRYGGSGGSVAIASAFASEIALHEMGHSIAGLADEYSDGQIKASSPYVEGTYANVSEHSDPELVPWEHWIEDKSNYPVLAGVDGIGVFQGAFYDETDYFRPVSASRMRFIARNFGPVNGEQWAISVYDMTNPVDYVSPVQQDLTLTGGQFARFYLEPVFGTEVQTVEWLLNGEVLADFNNLTDISYPFESGAHVFEVKVYDDSDTIRDPASNAGNFTWAWNLNVQ